MIMDKCLSHTKFENLSNVGIKFLLPNTASVLQPSDQGIIKNFEKLYRKLLLISVVVF